MRKKPKIEMTKTETAKAIILGSFILYLVDALLDRSEQQNGTTIRLKQAIRAKTRDASYLPFISMSNKAWFDVVEEFKDKNMHLVIFDAVEFLAFDNEVVMTKMFSKKFLNLVSAFSLKQTRDGVDNELLKESRVITTALKKSLEKVVFQNKGIL